MIRSYSNDELIKLMDAAPLLVQQAIESKATGAVISGLGTRLGLHIDQIGNAAALNVKALLGLITPQEFLQELIAAGISDKDAREIMTEINQKIFVPLRKKEEESGEVQVQQPVQPVELPKPVVPQQSVSPAAPEVRPSPTLPKVVPEGASHFKLENKITPAHIAPLPPKTAMPQSWGSQTSPTSLGEAVRSALAAPKPLETNRLLEDHEEPSIAFAKSQPITTEIRPAPTLPKVAPEAPLVPTVPVAPPAPVNLPGAMPSFTIPSEIRVAPDLPSVAPPAEPLPPKPAFVAPVEPKPVTPLTVPAPNTSYSSDPYREPIDEVPVE